MAYKINEDLYIGNTNKQLKDLLVPVHDAYSTSTTDTYSCNYINHVVETGCSSNYNNLSNKPSINGVILEGNKTSEDLGINILTDNQILWGPDYYFMSGGNTISLSQKVSAQKTGIVLVWQAYSDGKPQPWDYNFTFIPKWQAITNSSRGVVCYLATSHAGYIGTKYVYLFDDKIKGQDRKSVV